MWLTMGVELLHHSFSYCQSGCSMFVPFVNGFLEPSGNSLLAYYH